MPTVSVIMPSYNHARYVGMAIDSVLGQTLQDIELIVIDDASTDGTQHILRGIKDKRVRCVLRDRNVGASQGSNEGIAMARSPFIAMISSDDLFFPSKLQRQLNVLKADAGIAAVFCRPAIIDDTGREYAFGSHRLQHEFLAGTWQRPELLRQLFLHGNFLCHPSILIRREIYDQVGLYDVRLSSLGDFDMWMRIGVACTGAFVVLDEPLMAFRSHAGNASGLTDANLRCGHNEWPLVAERLFGLRNQTDVAAKAFPEIAALLHNAAEDVDYAMSRMALNHPVESVRAFGLQRLYALLADQATADYFAAVHRFTPRDLIKLSQETGAVGGRRSRSSFYFRLSRVLQNSLRVVRRVMRRCSTLLTKHGVTVRQR